MLIRDVLSPIDGLFSNMPDDIWGPDFDPSMLDIELFTRVGRLDTSPLADYFTTNGVLDTAGLAKLVHQRYRSNWKRIWDALQVEYNIMLTTSVDETRTSKRATSGTETRDLTGTNRGTVGNVSSNDGSTVRTGSLSTSSDSETTKNLTDTETRALTGSTKESGTEGVDETTSRNTTGDSTVTYAGSEKTSRSEDETTSGDSTLTISGTETTSGSDEETRDLAKRNTGTVTEAIGEGHTGTGSHTVDSGQFGVGGTGLVNNTRNVDSENRNFRDTHDSTRTDNTTETDSGTVDHARSEVKSFSGRTDKTVESGSKDVSGEETKSFTGRNDKTAESGTETGTASHDTTYGKNVATTDGGTVTSKQTGTDGTAVTSTDTYNSIKDLATGSETATRTDNLTSTDNGTVGNVGNESLTENFHSEGSSPLRTFQALIQEEIEGRSGQGWNFTDIAIRDVQSMIASKIWRRHIG